VIYTQQDVFEKLHVVVSFMLDCVGKMQNNAVAIIDDGRNIKTFIQALFAHRYSDSLSATLHELVLSNLIIAERNAPGAAKLMLALIDEQMSGVQIEKSYVTRSACRDELFELVQDAVNDNHALMNDVVKEAIDVAGFGGKIVIEKSLNEKFIIEKVDGYTFYAEPQFAHGKRFQEPRIFCIDGFIETVGEIHHMLEEVVENEVNVVLFVRGLADDVTHTLRVNYDRKTLNVLPVIVPFDVQGINMLGDIASILSSDVFSSAKGDLISSIRLKDACYADSIRIEQGSVIITKKGSLTRSLPRAQHLRQKRDVVEEDLAMLYDKRIRSLTPNCVVIRVPTGIEYVRNVQAIDAGLRTFGAVVEHGVSKFRNKLYPASTVKISVMFAKNTISSLNSIGAVITP
jgi:chaperonin GroEL (HSP60 family)